MGTGSVEEVFPRPLRGCLFDLDGTLLDSLGSLYRVYSSFLEKQGFSGTREEFEELNGLPTYQILVHLNAKYTMNLSQQQLEQEYRDLMENIYLVGPQLFPGARSVVALLQTKEIPLGIVTAASRSFVTSFLARHQLDVFTTITTAEDVGIGKPDPAIYRKALDDLGCLPHEVVAIEDSYSGVTSASETGIYIFWIFAQQNYPNLTPPKKVFPMHDWEEIEQIFQFHLAVQKG